MNKKETISVYVGKKKKSVGIDYLEEHEQNKHDAKLEQGKKLKAAAAKLKQEKTDSKKKK